MILDLLSWPHYSVPKLIRPCLVLTCALTLSCRSDMGSLLCFITTRYGAFFTAPISSWNFCRDDCLITRVFAETEETRGEELSSVCVSWGYHLISHTDIFQKGIKTDLLNQEFASHYWQELCHSVYSLNLLRADQLLDKLLLTALLTKPFDVGLHSGLCPISHSGLVRQTLDHLASVVANGRGNSQRPQKQVHGNYITVKYITTQSFIFFMKRSYI